MRQRSGDRRKRGRFTIVAHGEEQRGDLERNVRAMGEGRGNRPQTQTRPNSETKKRCRKQKARPGASLDRATVVVSGMVEWGRYQRRADITAVTGKSKHLVRRPDQDGSESTHRRQAPGKTRLEACQLGALWSSVARWVTARLVGDIVWVR